MEQHIPAAFEADYHSLSPAKALAIESYRTVSQPLRWWLAKRQAARNHARVMIFFYHRVAADGEGAWTTSPDVFRRQMRWLKSYFKLVTLEEAQRRVREGNSEPVAHVTFDDGYADNCVEALPLLVSEKIPATYFVTTENVLLNKPFVHDLLRRKPLAINTPSQIRAMADVGIEIGSHTRTHIDLGTVTDADEARREIVDSKYELEEMTGRPVRYFAFPFGRRSTLTPLAMRTVHEAGYEAVVSAYGGYNFPGDDAFHLQRMHGDNDLARFKNWATMDPRKLDIKSTKPQTISEEQTV